jgi:hypothetical protein
MKNIDLDKMDDLELFKALTKGMNISDAVHGDYAELINVFGEETALKMFKHFRGCKINCPKYLYKQDFIVQLAAAEPNKRQREKIAILCGYTAGRLEALVKEHIKNHT